MATQPQGRPLRVWEAEVMVRAAAWILVWRGLGLAVGGAVGTAAQRGFGDSPFGVLQRVAIPALLLVGVGLALLCRLRIARWVQLPLTVAWFLLLASPFAPEWMGNDGSWDPFRLAKDLVALAFLPAFLLPDLFALLAVFRRAAKDAFAASEDPLAGVARAWRVRLTGRVLVSLGMVTLAFLSAAVCLLGLPGLMIA